MSIGRRATDWELKGVPVRLEVGPRDLADGVATLVRRITRRAEGAACRSTASPTRSPPSSTTQQAALLDRGDRAARVAHRRRHHARRRASKPRPTGWARIPWATVGAEGEAELAQAGVSVRCLRRADGSLPESDARARPRRASSRVLLSVPFPIPPPVSPMLAKLARELPASGGKLGDLLYEPKWDGFRAIVFRDGDDVEIGSRNEKPLTRYFPELVEPLRAQPARALRRRRRDRDRDRAAASTSTGCRCGSTRRESRVAMLAEETPAAFVAFDLLAEGDDDLRERAVRASGARGSRRLLGDAEPPVLPHAGDHRPRRRAASGSSASRAPGSTA